MLRVTQLTRRLRDLVAERLELEGVMAFDVGRFTRWKVVEVPRADDAEPAVQRLEVLAQCHAGRAMVKFVRVQP